MQQLHYCLGLPRTCSTVLMNILNENPRIFTTGTCPIPYLIGACKDVSTQMNEFIAMDKDVLNSAYLNFLKQGIKGWFESMTHKPIIFSKSRVWAEYFTHTFALDSNSKYLVTIRDLRDIICSFETLTNKYPNYPIGDAQVSFENNTFEKRIELYCNYKGFGLGRSLHMLPHVMEMVRKYPNNFFILKQEDLNQNPKQILHSIYEWLGEEYFEHDLDNIPVPNYYEHDAIYRCAVTHNTGSKLKKIEPKWSKMMTYEQSQMVIHNNQWFYQTFYPEFLFSHHQH